MKRTKFGLILVLAIMVLVSVASAGLPTQVTGTIYNPDTASGFYWDLDVTSQIPSTGDIPPGDYDAHCASTARFISEGLATFNVYSSFYPPAWLPPQNWQKVNYLLNIQDDDGLTDCTVQHIVWYYDSGSVSGYCTPQGSSSSGLMATTIDKIDDAIFDNPAYRPQPGEKYAVILTKSQGSQPIFIIQDVPENNLPEFPTIALPVGMIIGIVGLVYIVRNREN